MNRLQTLQDWGMAWALGLGLLALGAAMDQREEEMNLNIPAIEQGPLTADDLAAWRAAHEPATLDDDQIERRWYAAQGHIDVGQEPRGQHRDGWLTGLWLRICRALT